MLVFVLVGPWAGAEHWLWALAMRWGIITQTADVTTVALIQPLHGLTFALFHLGYASLRILSRAASPVWRRRFMGPSELAVQRTC